MYYGICRYPGSTFSLTLMVGTPDSRRDVATPKLA
jgi:hypothetical protein